jgi:hypothetical protein
MFKILFAITAENVLVKYAVHCGRSNVGSESDFFVKMFLT